MLLWSTFEKIIPDWVKSVPSNVVISMKDIYIGDNSSMPCQIKSVMEKERQ